MGKDLWERSSEVQRLFECAADTTGTDIRNIIFNGSEEDLRVTETAQIAVTLINLCVAEVLKENGITCSGGAGFSLGEFSAMTLAGVLSREDVFPLVKARGEIMRLAAVTHDNGTGGPGMAAVIGHSLQEITDIISDNGIVNLL